MKKFKYKGYDENSVAQVGTLEAENYAEAYAVLQFQGMFNMATDGVVGRYTWTAISEALKGKIFPKDTDMYMGDNN